jgi:hypothetical protein
MTVIELEARRRTIAKPQGPMARARHSVDIARPIEDVFNFVANGTNRSRPAILGMPQ